MVAIHSVIFVTIVVGLSYASPAINEDARLEEAVADAIFFAQDAPIDNPRFEDPFIGQLGSYGGHCTTPCAHHGHKYSWCWADTVRWDYCSPNNGDITAHGRRCRKSSSCTHGKGHRYTWCWTTTKRWDYCVPTKSTTIGEEVKGKLIGDEKVVNENEPVNEAVPEDTPLVEDAPLIKDASLAEDTSLIKDAPLAQEAPVSDAKEDATFVAGEKDAPVAADPFIGQLGSYGGHCTTPCAHHGHQYAWCWADTVRWDYCSPNNGDITAHGRRCKASSKCGHGKGHRYTWCWTTTKRWDYCVPTERSTIGDEKEVKEDVDDQ